MGWLHGVEGGRVSTTCQHGLEGFCRRCAFPTQEEAAADKLAAEQTAEAERVAAEAEKKAADELAAEQARHDAEYISSLTPYELACWENRWEDAYALLPAICYLSEFDPDGYPPPTKKVKKPSFTQFWETMTGCCKSYSDQP